MKYYIEVKKGGEVLKKYSRVCEEWNYNTVLAMVVISVMEFAEKVTIYTHDGLNNSQTIEIYSEISFPELAA